MLFVKIWREVRESSRVMIRPHGTQEPPPVVKMDTRLNTEAKVKSVKRHLRVCHRPYPSQTDGQDVWRMMEGVRRWVQPSKHNYIDWSDGFELGGFSRSIWQREGGVVLRFSRIHIILSWQQQESTQELFCWSQPSHPGSICLSGLFHR